MWQTKRLLLLGNFLFLFWNLKKTKSNFRTRTFFQSSNLIFVCSVSSEQTPLGWQFHCNRVSAFFSHFHIDETKKKHTDILIDQINDRFGRKSWMICLLQSTFQDLQLLLSLFITNVSNSFFFPSLCICFCFLFLFLLNNSTKLNLCWTQNPKRLLTLTNVIMWKQCTITHLNRFDFFQLSLNFHFVLVCFLFVKLMKY